MTPRTVPRTVSPTEKAAGIFQPGAQQLLVGQGDAFGGPVKGFHRCQNFLPHPEPLVWMADPGGGDVLRGQQGHDAPANVPQRPRRAPSVPPGLPPRSRTSTPGAFPPWRPPGAFRRESTAWGAPLASAVTASTVKHTALPTLDKTAISRSAPLIHGAVTSSLGIRADTLPSCKYRFKSASHRCTVPSRTVWLSAG